MDRGKGKHGKDQHSPTPIHEHRCRMHKTLSNKKEPRKEEKRKQAKKEKELQYVSSLRARDLNIGECLSVCLFKMIHFYAECVAGNLHLLCVPRSVSNTFSVLIVASFRALLF